MDYDALATDFGGSVAESTVDYDKLATDLGGSSVEAIPSTVPSKSILDTATEVGLGTLDAAIPLIGGPMGWLAETGAKWGTVGLGHVGDILAKATGDRVGLRASPEEILEASKALASEKVGSKFYQPQTEIGRGAVENVGEALHTVLAPARWAGEEATRRGFPTTGEYLKDFGELSIFGLVGGVGSKVGSALKKPMPSAKFPTEGEGAAGGEPSSGPTGSSKLMSNEALTELGRAEKVKKGPDAKIGGNQEIVNLLLDSAAKVEGTSPKDAGRRGFYNRTAKLIVELEKDLEDVDLGTLPGFKDPKGKTRLLVEELLKKRREVVEESVSVGEDIPIELPSQEVPTKVPVTSLGMQEMPGKEPVLLVNEPSGTTKVFDPEKHELVASKVEEAPVEEAPPKVEEAAPPEKVVSEFDTSKIAREEGYTLDKRAFSTEESATVVASMLGPEWEAVPTPTVPTELPPVSEDFVQKVREAVEVAKKQGDSVRLVREFQEYRNSLVEKFNRARDSKVEPGDLEVLDDAFRTFASKEGAIKAGRTGKLVQDPLTGRWFEEPKFESLEDLGWEHDQGDLNLKSDEVRWSDDFEVREGEVSEGRVKDLWDILGDERGSGPLLVDPENLKLIRDRVKEWMRRAKKAGVELEEYLVGQGISEKTREEVLRVVEQLDEVNKKVREQNTIVEDIFNPPEESIISQKVKASKKKEGTFLVDVPYTKEWEDRLRNTVNTMDRWPSNLVGKFMKFNEIPMKAFKRMGLDELWWSWVKQESRRLDRVRDIKKEFKELRKGFSDKEIYEMSLVTEARQKHGPEILKEMGITKIPELTLRQEAALSRFTKLYDQFLEEMNYVRTHTGREPLPKEKNYFTRVRQYNILKSKGIIGSLADTPIETVSGLFGEFTGKYNPYSEKRVKAADLPVELNIFDNLNKYVEFTSKDIYISPVAALAKKLSTSKVRMNPKDLSREGSTLASLHPGAAELLRRWSDEILGVHMLNNFYKEYAGLKTTSDLLHRNIVYATILFSPTTVAKQFGAFTGTIAEVGLTNTLRGMAKFATENPKSLWKGELTRARAKSDVLKIRGFAGEAYFENLHDQWLAGKLGGKWTGKVSRSLGERVGRAKELTAKVGGIGMYLTDYITAESSWNAFYDFARRTKHMSEAEAFRFAEDRTAKTQVIGVRGATAPIQNIPGLDLFTIFQTFAIGDFNYIARDLLKIKNPEPTNFRHFAKVARYVVGAYLINSAFQGAGIDEPHPAPVEAYRETKKEGGSEQLAIAKALTEYFEKLPQIGGALKYSSPLGGPAVDLMADIPVAAQAIVGVVDWDTMSKKQKIKTVLLVADVLGRSLGVPGTRSMIKSARAYAAGGNKWEVLMGIYVDATKKRGGKLPSLRRTAPSLVR